MAYYILNSGLKLIDLLKIRLLVEKKVTQYDNAIFLTSFLTNQTFIMLPDESNLIIRKCIYISGLDQ
jgi:hypothetical protein